MIWNFEKINVTSHSKPFASAVGKLDFEQSGYVEEEYFFDGTANVYEEEGDRAKKVIHENMHYKNRILVRKPENMNKFQGNIVIEILNATAGFDLDRMWVVGAKELMRRGTVYVGITSKPDMLDPLCQFDQKRYESLTWKITYERMKRKMTVQDELVYPRHSECETGLIWDMLTDLAEFLKGENHIVTSVKEKRIYLTGWSQSANYLTTYVRYFMDECKEKKLFNGFLAAGNVHTFVTPLNQEGYGNDADEKRTMVDEMPYPFIAVQTETEAVDFNGIRCRQENKNDPEMKYCCYEFAGPTHDTMFSLMKYYADDKEMESLGLTPQYMGIHKMPNDFPHEFLFYAVYRQLFEWGKSGKMPALQMRILTDAEGAVLKDRFGNTRGGVRSPFTDVPYCTYHSCSKIQFPDGTEGENPLFGYSQYFEKEKMMEEYQTLERYKEQFLKAAENAVYAGALLAEDVEECLEKAIEDIEKIGFR